MPRILDLYCGMGGLSLGFALGLGNAEILGLDIDKYTVETYNLNLNRFNARALVQDVLKWEPHGEFDVVMGGSPCQPFSLAVNPRYGKVGKSHPLYPTFPHFFDVILALKPKVFLLENVKGLLTRRHRDILEEQLKRVEPHYNVRYQVLNVAFYGVPQRRERLFVLGIRRDLGVVPSFPSPTHGEGERATLSGRLFRWVTVREAIGDLLSVPPQGLVLTPEQVVRIRREREDTSRHLAKMEFPDNLDEPSRTVSSHTVEGAKRETIVVPITEHVMTEKGGWVGPKSDWGSRVMDAEKPSYTITEKHRSGQLVPIQPTTDEAMARPSPVLVTDARIYAAGRRDHGTDAEKGCFRRLTVRECLRLQSFPDWWSFPSNVSVSRKYKLVGEAVPPILAYRLAVHIGRLMGWEVREPPKAEEWQLPYFARSFADYLTTAKRR